MSEVTMKPVTMTPEEDQTNAIYVSIKSSRNMQPRSTFEDKWDECYNIVYNAV
jgi:hypothetical protein